MYLVKIIFFYLFFRCTEANCIAAFTTKQCLQFHYKKVHGFTEDKMPKIQRTVEYTFEAYSGLEDRESMPDSYNKQNGVDNFEQSKNVENVDGDFDENTTVMDDISI